MESESRLNRIIGKISDWLNEQDWFQQLKTKWEELDPQSRLYLKFAGAGGATLLVLFVILSSVWNVHSLKKEYRERESLLTMIESANDEIRTLRESAPSETSSGDEKANWNAYFEATAGNAGIEKTALEVGNEKAGTAMEQAKETLFDLKVKHVTIKQVVRYAFFLENGNKPVKIRNMTIDTKADPTGYMDAMLAVSGFTLVAANK